MHVATHKYARSAVDAPAKPYVRIRRHRHNVSTEKNNSILVVPYIKVGRRSEPNAPVGHCRRKGYRHTVRVDVCPLALIIGEGPKETEQSPIRKAIIEPKVVRRVSFRRILHRLKRCEEISGRFESWGTALVCACLNGNKNEDGNSNGKEVSPKFHEGIILHQFNLF